MKDLTRDSIIGHVLRIAAPAVISMVAQIACQLVDLYFVTSISAVATAGVSAAGNAVFVVNAAGQVLATGTVVLVAHAVGRKDQSGANLIFNQSLMLSVFCSVLLMVLLRASMSPYLHAVAADMATIDAGVEFISWALPGFALVLPMGVLSSALRGTGVVHPTFTANMLMVAVNVILAPVLIAGWGTDLPLGVKGAGLATSISTAVGVASLVAYVQLPRCYVTFTPRLMRPIFGQCQRLLTLGLPAGGEFALVFLSTAIAYYTIRGLGAEAQAGFSIGSRVLQAILLPGIALAFAAGPIAGQNFSARYGERVKATFWATALAGVVLMTAFTIVVQLRSIQLVRVFAEDAEVITVAALFLQLMSWTFVAQSVVYTCYSMFLGLGTTVPLLTSSAARLFSFAGPALWLCMQAGFRIEHVWYASIASIMLQALLSLLLLRVEFRRRLPPMTREWARTQMPG